MYAPEGYAARSSWQSICCLVAGGTARKQAMSLMFGLQRSVHGGGGFAAQVHSRMRITNGGAWLQ